MMDGLIRRVPWLAYLYPSAGSQGGIRNGLIREASGTFALRVFAVGFGFVLTLILSRTLGAADYGAYRYATAWVELLAVPGILGMHRLVVRDVSAYHAQEAWGLMKGLIRRSNQVVLATSLLVVAVAGVAAWLLIPAGKSLKLYTLLLALPLMPFETLTRLRQAAVQGFQRVVLSQVPELLFSPVVFAMLVLGAYLLLPDNLYSVYAVLLIDIAVTAAAFGIGAFMLHALLPPPTRDVEPVFRTRAWLNSALPLLLANGIVVINTQATSIILGTLRESKLVGVYSVANQGAGLMLFVYMAANNALAPAFARLHVKGETVRLQRLTTSSARLILLFSLPIVLGLVVFGRYFLALFGSAFTHAYDALLILCVGQVVNAATGSGGWLLIMTGHEREAAWGSGIAALVNVGSNLVLVPLWGLNGAALAATGSYILQNLLLTWYVWRSLGIHATVLGPIRWPGQGH
jgi:O-antigen/teichoic acid export membrane protein